MAEQYANSVTTTLNGSITSGATSLIVASATRMPASGNFRLKIDNEILICTARTGTTLTVTRGAESTTAASHASGSTVSLVLTAAALQALPMDLTVATGDLPFSKFVQASAASKLVGRGSASGAGDFEEITLGSGLSMSGTTLSASGSGGDVTGQAASVDSEITLFSSTTGKVIKRATGTGIVRVSSGVYGTPGNVDLASEVTGALPASNLATASRRRAFAIVIDGGGSAITTGVKCDLRVPQDMTGTISRVSLLADQTGSIVVDLWKDTYANFPPTNADSITASAKPTLSSAAKSEDATLTGWTTSLSGGDCLRVNVDSATTVTRVTLTLEVLV